ncbi:GerMN domain-containing protein [Halobacillus sp. A1]|uniref:GerMN domain-containing protein n=1 Tax=Halobacillus sp. A1 TaxID=2880262 RepID=UPI0020A63CD3|nr:GerMN domain-containing protein [Halobacillus sp. A1]MCP3030500.1 GerMN domain-containing protein [Halobacillus sp. A1]
MKTWGIKPLTIVALMSMGMLTGCLFEGEQSLEEMDGPPEEEAASTDTITEETETESGEGEEGESTEEETSGTVERELYLLDSNGMVVPQTLEIPASENVAGQSLEYLVKDGPVTELLPSGFEAVLPAGTQIQGVNLVDGTMTVDVSKEFQEYEAEDEEKILQAMTFTLTQFDNVERIKLWINGHEQKTMPVSGTPISDGVSRSDGINVQESSTNDLVNSEPVTVYYPSQQDGEEVYQVPVTTRVASGEDLYTTVVQTLLNGPALGTSLMQPFNEGAEVSKAEMKDGVLSVTFNEAMLTGEETKALSNEALSSLVMSLTGLPDVESVEVMVEGVKDVLNEAGEPISEPVTKSDIQEAESL